MMPTMKLHHEIVYDATAAEVFAMLADPAFRERSAAAMGVISADVTITSQGEGMLVRIDQVQPTEGVPSFAKKFAGETTRAVQLEDWADTRHLTRWVLTVDEGTVTGYAMLVSGEPADPDVQGALTVRPTASDGCSSSSRRRTGLASERMAPAVGCSISTMLPSRPLRLRST